MDSFLLRAPRKTPSKDVSGSPAPRSRPKRQSSIVDCLQAQVANSQASSRKRQLVQQKPLPSARRMKRPRTTRLRMHAIRKVGARTPGVSAVHVGQRLDHGRCSWPGLLRTMSLFGHGSAAQRAWCRRTCATKLKRSVRSHLALQAPPVDGGMAQHPVARGEPAATPVAFERPVRASELAADHADVSHLDIDKQGALVAASCTDGRLCIYDLDEVLLVDEVCCRRCCGLYCVYEPHTLTNTTHVPACTWLDIVTRISGGATGTKRAPCTLWPLLTIPRACRL